MNSETKDLETEARRKFSKSRLSSIIRTLEYPEQCAIKNSLALAAIYDKQLNELDELIPSLMPQSAADDLLETIKIYRPFMEEAYVFGAKKFYQQKAKISGNFTLWAFRLGSYLLECKENEPLTVYGNYFVEVTNDQLLQLLKTREKSKNLVYWRIALCQNKNTNIIHHDRWNPDQKFNKFLEYCLSTSFEIDENNQNREKIIKSEVAQWLWQGINQNQISSDIWLYLASIIKCLSEDGKAAFIIPCALLEEPRYYREREFFVSQGCIDAVILLPKRVFSSGSGDYGLLMLSAPQPDKKKNIIFYDARRLGKDRELPHEEMEQIANELRNEKNAVSFEEVMQDNCVLYRENITYDDFIFEDIAKDITRGALFSTKELEFNAQASESNYQVLRLQDIQEGIIEKPLQPLAYIEDRHERYMLDSEIRLLICKNSVDSRFKTAIYNPEEWQEHKKILVTSNIYIIKLSQKVNPYYIQAYLESDEGQKQIADLIGKERFSSLGVSDLKLISVPYCEKQQQDQIAEEFKKIQKETAQCRKQLTDLSQKRKTFFSQKYHK